MAPAGASITNLSRTLSRLCAHPHRQQLQVVRALATAQNAAIIKPKPSYVHGASTIPLLNDTMGDRLRMAVEHVPDREVMVFVQEKIRKTYHQFLTDVEHLAGGLIALGAKQGDRVGIWCPNRYEWVVCQFATALAGLIQVNINPAYQSAELKFVLNKVGMKFVIAAPSFKTSDYYKAMVGIVPEIAASPEGRGDIQSHELPELKHLIMLGDQPHRGAWKYSEIVKGGQGSDAKKLLNEYENKVMPDDPVNIQFTSGTTGTPKGAALTHHNIVNNAYFLGLRSMFHERPTIFCVPCPLYHCMGCVGGTLCSVVHHRTCVFPSVGFESLATLQAIQNEGCTHVLGTPTMFIDMLNHPKFGSMDYSSMKSGFMAGAPCPVELCKRLVSKLNMTDLQIAYGTTETSPVTFMSLLEDPPEQRVRSVGHVMEHVEAKVVNRAGKTVPRGERGELVVRGYMVMRGYWGDEDKTRQDITPDRWYHAGDQAVMNEDGTLCIVGRLKDMIVRGGENVYPAEIEQYLFTHPHIEDAHVVGVPDDRMGEEICAWIRLHESAPKMTENDVKVYCKGKIAHYKIPRYVLFKKEHDFPLTVTGKVKKYELREISKLELGLKQVRSHFNE